VTSSRERTRGGGPAKRSEVPTSVWAPAAWSDALHSGEARLVMDGVSSLTPRRGDGLGGAELGGRDAGTGVGSNRGGRPAREGNGVPSDLGGEVAPDEASGTSSARWSPGGRDGTGVGSKLGGEAALDDDAGASSAR
jgi:hypothetical protein